MFATLLLLASLVNVPAASFDHRSAHECFDRLRVLSGYGRLPYERGAFLVHRDDGSFDCVVWPASNMRDAAEWSGAIPDRTAAIAHTHPNKQPEPSHNDVAVAQRLGIPVFVVTRDVVTSSLRAR
jgi:hypothetical protein